MPAIYEVDAKGKESLINTNVMSGNTITIQRLVPQVILRKAIWWQALLTSHSITTTATTTPQGLSRRKWQRVIRGDLSMSDNKRQDQDQDQERIFSRAKTKAAQQPMDEDEAFRQFNRKSSANKLTTIAGFVFIAIIGVGAIVAINKGPVEPPRRRKTARS